MFNLFWHPSEFMPLNFTYKHLRHHFTFQEWRTRTKSSTAQSTKYDAHCNSGQYFALLHRGIGCHVFVAPNGKDIAYELRPVGQSTSEQEVDRLHKYLSHRYARDWQNHCRDVVANKQIDGVHLHPNTSFFSMDLWSQRIWPIRSKRVCSKFNCAPSTMFKIFGGFLQKRGYFYLSVR